MQTTPTLSFSIAALDRASAAQAAAMLDRIVENSPWLAHRAADARPFGSVEALAQWLDTEVRGLARDEAVQLLCAHPELAPPAPTAMTQASQTEQGRLKLSQPTPKLAKQLAELNRQYLRRHGYPFVIALHAQANIEAVIAQFESRLAADPDDELPRSLGEVVSVMKSRLARLTGTEPAEPSQVPAHPQSQGRAT